MAKESRSRSVLGGGGGKSKSSGKSKKPHSVHVKHGASGGYIATHHFKHKQGEDPMESEDHVLPDQQAMLDHMEANMPEENGPAPAPSAGPAAAAPAAAAPAAGM